MSSSRCTTHFTAENGQYCRSNVPSIHYSVDCSIGLIPVSNTLSWLSLLPADADETANPTGDCQAPAAACQPRHVVHA